MSQWRQPERNAIEAPAGITPIYGTVPAELDDEIMMSTGLYTNEVRIGKQRMGCSVTAVYGAGSPPVFEPRPGNVYLIEEKRPRCSYDVLEQTIACGHAGLIITREFPKKLLGEKGVHSCKIVWLTNLVGDGRINPTATGILMSQVRGFIESHRKSVVMVDGLEYLISLNTYDRMLQFMHQLRDIVATNDCITIVPIDPRTMSERELALLERNMEPVIPRPYDVHEEPILAPDAGEIRILDVGPR
jgi:hypothetical protein